MAVSLHQASDVDSAETNGSRAADDPKQLGRLIAMLADEAIVIDPPETDEYKARLRTLAGRLAADTEAQLKLELHSYREAAEKKISHLRTDLASTADAMQQYVTRFSTQDQSQEKLLSTDLERLALIRRMMDITQIHTAIDAVRQSLVDTIEQMKAQNQAIIVQLRDEIRTLHKRLDTPGRRESQPGTLANRAPFERRIRAKIENQEIFSLYLIRITNWKEAINTNSQDTAQTLVNQIADRLARLLGPDTFTGRWYDGYFAAILAIDKRTAMEGASDLAQQLAGLYQVGGSMISIRARVAVVDHIQGQDADQMLRRVEQLIRAFEG